MLPENLNLLTESIASLKLTPPNGALERLVGYHDFLLEYNKNVNLTGFIDERESVIKNLLNALTPWEHVDPSRATADVGSGAGMPGIPLAIMLGMPRVSLIESKGKKCDFLRAAVAQFAPGVEVLQQDVNLIKRSFGQIVTIAYGTLAKLIEATADMRAPGTRLLAWKGRRETIDTEIAECKKTFRKWQVEKFQVPGLEAERHLCVFQL